MGAAVATERCHIISRHPYPPQLSLSDHRIKKKTRKETPCIRMPLLTKHPLPNRSRYACSSKKILLRKKTKKIKARMRSSNNSSNRSIIISFFRKKRAKGKKEPLRFRGGSLKRKNCLSVRQRSSR